MQLNLSFPSSFPSDVAWHPPLIRKARTRCNLTGFHLAARSAQVLSLGRLACWRSSRPGARGLSAWFHTLSCRTLHDFARFAVASQCLPAGNYGWRKCIQRGCFKNTSSVSFWSAQWVSWSYQDSWIQSNCVSDSWFCGLFLKPDRWRNHTRRC